jgi:hypothetical protein
LLGLVLLHSIALVGLVPADYAAGRRSKKAMVRGVMASYSAHRSTF